MKGIILAGGAGTRLYPLTISYSKQLLPVFDKPMIYYPLCTLMSANIKDILIITTPQDQMNFKKLLGTGNQWGINLEYMIQDKPKGIAEAFIIGEEFISNDNVALILGDNIFYGINMDKILTNTSSNFKGAKIFAYQVHDPERYGVIEINNEKVISIEEKPKKPKSPYVVTGLYFYDNTVFQRVKELTFSARGELEITDLNRKYLNDNLLNVKIMGRGMAWLDTGTIDSLQEASFYVKTLEHRQGLKIGCPEEVAWRQGWIDDLQLEKLAHSLSNSGYGKYLFKLLRTKFNRSNFI